MGNSNREDEGVQRPKSGVMGKKSKLHLVGW